MAGVWEEQTSTGEVCSPLPGSALAGDDRRLRRYLPSDASWRHLGVAVDNFVTLRSATSVDGVLTFRLYGQFPLVRAMIENASTALWLLSPHGRGERLLRRLQLEDDDIRKEESMRQLASQEDPSVGEERLAKRLGELRVEATSVGVGPGVRLRKPRYDDVVRAAGDVTDGLGGDLAVAFWKACSAIAHGDRWPLKYFPTREPLVSRVPGISAFKLTPKVDALYSAVLAGYVLIDRTIGIWNMRFGQCLDGLPPR